MENILLKSINQRLSRLEELAIIAGKSILDLDETVIYTGFSKGYLYRMTSERQIPHYKKNRKLYFKKAELDAWMLDSKIVTMDEVDRKANEYILNNKNN